MQVLVRDNNVDQALKALKKKMQREGIFREMKLRGHYEKPSERKAREKARDEARRKLEEELRNKTFKPLPEFGSDEDFQLRQALNRLQGKPVKASATLKARPVESAEAEDGADKPRK